MQPHIITHFLQPKPRRVRRQKIVNHISESINPNAQVFIMKDNTGKSKKNRSTNSDIKCNIKIFTMQYYSRGSNNLRISIFRASAILPKITIVKLRLISDPFKIA